MKKNNRVYGLVGIKSIMANWNADFTGRPKTTSNSNIFGSDKALKYPMKKMWQNEGEKVLFIRTYKLENDKKEGQKLQPRDLKEQYNNLFGDVKDAKNVLKDLFSAVDVMNFGATFAEKGVNLSLTGVVQINQGFNKYEDTSIETQDILSPFRNSNKDDSNQSTLGSKIVTDEAHYVYSFSVNPKNYEEYMQLGIDGFEGYTKEAYEKFKKGCLVAVTAFNTNSKSGCENEFALFIECKDESLLYLANIDSYVKLSKNNEGMIELDFTQLGEVLKPSMEQIEKIDLYYNKINTLVNTGELKCNIFNILEPIY